MTSLSDMGSGLSVDGADFSQTSFEIDGVPVYFPYRLGGVFSAFNTWHFQRVSFERSPFSGSLTRETRFPCGVSYLRKTRCGDFHGQGERGTAFVIAGLAGLPLGENQPVGGGTHIIHKSDLWKDAESQRQPHRD